MSPPSASEFDSLARALATLLAAWWCRQASVTEGRSSGRHPRSEGDVR